MDLLKLFVGKLNTLPGYLTILIILACMSIGLYFKHFTQHIDHKFEEIAELLLDQYGIEIDFSEDKKVNND